VRFLRRWFSVLSAIAAAATFILLSAPPAAALSSVPAYARDFPDPTVVRAGGQFWAYSTGSGGTNIQVMSSSDLQSWTPTTEALPSANMALSPAGWETVGNTWAPGVLARTKPGSTVYVMYFTVRQTSSGRQCISVATSATPGAPFTDTSSGPLVCQLPDHGGSIDPSPFVAPDGTLYLLLEER
jgi:beta-xylosidase